MLKTPDLNIKLLTSLSESLAEAMSSPSPTEDKKKKKAGRKQQSLNPVPSMGESSTPTLARPNSEQAPISDHVDDDLTPEELAEIKVSIFFVSNCRLYCQHFPFLYISNLST